MQNQAATKKGFSMNTIPSNFLEQFRNLIDSLKIEALNVCESCKESNNNETLYMGLSFDKQNGNLIYKAWLESDVKHRDYVIEYWYSVFFDVKRKKSNVKNINLSIGMLESIFFEK